MSDELDPTEVLVELAARIRPVHDPQSNEVWPDSYIARMRECERLAGVTQYPHMAALMRELAGVFCGHLRKLVFRSLRAV
jgi:hypothetical protein